MIIFLKLVGALTLLGIWTLVTFYIAYFIYLLPARYPWLAGLPQFGLGLVVLLASMLSYAVTVSRLFWKKTA